MQVECKCKDWRKGIKQIGDQAAFCANHAHAPQYDAPVFRHCPWCGRYLLGKPNKPDEVLAQEISPADLHLFTKKVF